MTAVGAMNWAMLAFVYHLASRLAYVVGIGAALAAQDRQQIFTRRAGVEVGFARFRRLASMLMSNDALSFVLLCVSTQQSFPEFASERALAVAGLVLIAVGVSVRLWANALLGSAAYYWHNFFAPDDALVPERRGPYRFLKNPMYSLGYMHTYGIALFCGSLPGLLAAVVGQLLILIFCEVVEKPHFDALTKATVALGSLPAKSA